MEDRVVVVAGKFDPILRGHLDHIKKAKALGGRLVVITHSDDVVALARAREGKVARCIVPLEDRIANLLALRWVDDVVVSIDKDGTCAETLKVLKPDIFAKGGDRTPNNMPQNEIDACKEIGCEIRYGIGDLLTHASEVVAKC